MLAEKSTTRNLFLKAEAHKLLEEILTDLNPNYGSGAVTVAAYDTAWVARVRMPHQPKQLAFPEALKWLLDNQAASGSWGETYPYTLLPTLAGLLALVTTPQPTAQIYSAIVKARDYLQNALANWTIEGYEICGFEVLAPALLTQLEEYCFEFEFPDKPALLQLYKAKMAVAGSELIYKGRSNLLYSLEAFGHSLDWQRLKRYQSITGGYGCSPAATAAALIYSQEWDSAAYNWLKRLTATYSGAVPNTYPLDCFEVAWVLNNLSYSQLGLSGLPKSLLQQLMDWLQFCLTASGTGCSLTGGLPPDADCTSVVIRIMCLMQLTPKLGSLLGFERDNYFLCYETERDPSPSANAHVLEALLSLTPQEQSLYSLTINKVTNYLQVSRNPAGYWQDKWHLSPYYATACSTLALAKHPVNRALSLLQPTIDWLLSSSWWKCAKQSREESAPSSRKNQSRQKCTSR